MKSQPTHGARTAGFTLTEVLVAFTIIIVLAALTFMGARRAMDSARIGKSMFHLRELGTVFATYAAEYGHCPPGWDGSYGRGPVDRNGVKMSGRSPDLDPPMASDFPIHGCPGYQLESPRLAYYRQETQRTGFPQSRKTPMCSSLADTSRHSFRPIPNRNTSRFDTESFSADEGSR